MPDGGTVPYRLPMGALNYIDQKQYIHNMEIHAHFPTTGSVTIGGGEPLTTLWARGKQRMIPGSGGFIDISDGRNPIQVNKNLCPGVVPNIAYNTKIKKWIRLQDALGRITSPTPQHPHGKFDYGKEELDKLLAAKRFKGIRNYDVTDPRNPVLLEEFSTGDTGSGTHDNFYDGGQYAYLDCGWDDQLRMEEGSQPFSHGLMIVDVRIRAVPRKCLVGGCPGSAWEKRKNTRNIGSPAIAAHSQATTVLRSRRSESRMAERLPIRDSEHLACSFWTSATSGTRSR